MEQRIEIIVRLIDDNPYHEPTLAELARQVNLSPHRLRHLFKVEMGMSLSQYRKSLRLQKAKELIETTFLTIKEIRVRVGVKDKSRFARDFRKAYGLTPAQYRTRFRAPASDKTTERPKE